MSRSLGQLFASSDRLSGEEAQTLREYCNTVEIEPEKSLKDPYGILLKEANLTAFQEHFESRVQHFEGRRHEAAQELFKLRWGATRIPIYLVLLAFTNQPGDALRHKYFTLAKWLVETAKVPVDGTDVSGTSTLMYCISTKPYFEPEFAQLMLDAGGDINRRDRFGGTTGHDITTVQLLYEPMAHEKAARALQWYLEHGGQLDVEDGDGTNVRRIIANLVGTDRTLKGVVDKFEQERKDGKFADSEFPKPTARNSPCPCGSSRKFKKCCGKE